MSFLTNIFERRLNENMNKHRMDAKIAPSRPKPACRLSSNDSYLIREQKQETLKRFFAAQEIKEQAEVSVTPPSPPPHYQEESFFEEKPQLMTTGSQSSLFEAKKPAAAFSDVIIKRCGSQESGIGSEVGSVSYAA